MFTAQWSARQKWRDDTNTNIYTAFYKIYIKLKYMKIDFQILDVHHSWHFFKPMPDVKYTGSFSRNWWKIIFNIFSKVYRVLHFTSTKTFNIWVLTKTLSCPSEFVVWCRHCNRREWSAHLPSAEHFVYFLKHCTLVCRTITNLMKFVSLPSWLLLSYASVKPICYQTLRLTRR